MRKNYFAILQSVNVLFQEGMYSKMIRIILLLCIFDRISISSAQHQIIGIFSKCDGKTNNTDLQRRAVLYDNVINETFHIAKAKYPNFKNLEYLSWDVCEDYELLINLTTSFILDFEFNTQFNASLLKFNDKHIINDIHRIKNKNSILFFVSYLSVDLNNLFLRILLARRWSAVLVLNIRNKIDAPGIAIHYPTLFDNLDFESLLISKTITAYKWKRIGLLFLTGPKTAMNKYYSQMQERVIRKISQDHPEVCYYTSTINTRNSTQLNNAAEILHTDLINNILVLFGTPKDQIYFIKTVNIEFYKFIWLAHDLDRSKIFSNFVRVEMDINILNYRTDMRKLILEHTDKFKQRKHLFEKYFVQNGSVAEMANAMFERVFSNIGKTKKIVHNSLFNILRFPLLIRGEVILIDKGTPVSEDTIFYGENLLDASLLTGFDEKYKVLSDLSRCDAYQCPPGWEQSRGELLKQFTKWEFEYGFTCKQCQPNFIKPKRGNAEKCDRCSRYYLSNVNHTKCFDPYHEQFLMKDTIYFTTFTLTSLGMALSVFTLIIFVIYRNTPIIKSSDFLLTVIHLMTAIFINTDLITLSHSKPRELTCCLDAIIAGNLYTFFIAIVLMKSHKILNAFNSMHRLSTKRKRNTILQQWFTIFILTVSSFIWTFIAMETQKVNVQSRRDTQIKIIYIFCRNIRPKTIQLAFAGLLQLATFIIAYKGRNLPDIFNESMSLLYASFASTMSYVVVFILLRFKSKDAFFQASIIWLAISLNLNIYILLCYGKKVYIVLFKKEKNTRNYIQRKTFESNCSNNLRTTHESGL